MAEHKRHQGHRQRMRERVQNYGLDSLAEHEALEYVLYLTNAQKDTNGIAHDLIDRFGDFAAVLEAMYTNVKKTEFLKACDHYQLPVNKKIKDFSTGMKAKVKILAAISHKPSFLLLDEPTAGLDVLAREDLLNMLRDYMEEDDTRSILISSHISTDLEGLCDDLYMIDKGRIVLHEDMDTLLGQYGLLKMTREQYETVDKQYFLRKRKESYGYSILTNEKQFYLENYPQITMENGNIDDVIAMMVKGEAV